MSAEVDSNCAWNQPEWREKALAWVRSELEARSLPISSEAEQFHRTAWSTVMRVPTRAEDLYFKAVASDRQFETRLTALLSSRHPHMMPKVVAVHPHEAWIILKDMGRQYRGSLRATGDLSPLERALPVLAEIQMESAAHTAGYVSLGVPKRPLREIPGYLDIILADRPILTASEYALTAEQIEKLASLRPMVEHLAAELGANRIPLTLHHDDLHDANIFLKDGVICFSDWGDACIAHPFFSLLILLRSVSDSLKCEVTDPRILKLRDIYLEQWVQYESMDKLRRLFSLAWRLGMINRAYSWYTDLQTYEESCRTKYAYTVPGWLGDFLETMQASPENNP